MTTQTAQTDDTRRILDMLSQGKITVDEADRLLKAVGASAADTAAPTRADPTRARWIRINIQKPATDDGHKAKNVNIRVRSPSSRAGCVSAPRSGRSRRKKPRGRMKAQGLDIDLAKINSDLSQMNGPEFDEFLKSLSDTNIEIDDGKAQVRITANEISDLRVQTSDFRPTVCTWSAVIP